MSTSEFTTETLEFWQARTCRALSEEDAREISETLFEFYCILHEWHLQDRDSESEYLQGSEVS